MIGTVGVFFAYFHEYEEWVQILIKNPASKVLYIPYANTKRWIFHMLYFPFLLLTVVHVLNKNPTAISSPISAMLLSITLRLVFRDLLS